LLITLRQNLGSRLRTRTHSNSPHAHAHRTR
jgi:hypothetical protein